MSYRVLIIDDEPWSREVVKALGKWENMQLTISGEAEDGTQGLKMIDDLRPDIVITDICMPGIEGVELLKAISGRFPALKIIIMSGYDNFVYLKQAIRSGAVEYLLKPVDPQELNASLAKCVEGLEQSRLSSGTFLEKIPVFEDALVLDRYIAFRQLIYGHLMELNKQAVLDTLDKMKEFIRNSHQETKNANMLAKIGNDFILLLEEFLSGNEVTLNHIWNEKNRDWICASGWVSFEEMTNDIKWLYEKSIDAVKESNRNRKSMDLKKVQTYIDRYFHEPISLDTIAQHFFISKEHLSRSFRTFTGENISDYILRRRMEKARELILEQGLEIKHAAQMTGYEDLAYFYRVFKKYFGFTPGELRRDV